MEGFEGLLGDDRLEGSRARLRRALEGRGWLWRVLEKAGRSWKPWRQTFGSERRLMEANGDLWKQ